MVRRLKERYGVEGKEREQRDEKSQSIGNWEGWEAEQEIGRKRAIGKKEREGERTRAGVKEIGKNVKKRRAGEG